MKTRRPELSKKSKYYISKHRYYELMHFCLRYPEMKEEYNNLVCMSKTNLDGIKGTDTSDPTCNAAIKAAKIQSDMKLIETAAYEADPSLSFYIFKHVTEDKSIAWCEAEGIPCCRDVFYDRCRKFFKILDSRK